jgi:phenylacetate-CoA ligase
MTDNERLSQLLRQVLSRENFNARRLRAAGCHEHSLITDLPFTTKADLLADQLEYAPFGSCQTEPLERYTRFCLGGHAAMLAQSL